jgi:8-oxo-dGTP diphosphatase
MILQEEIIDFIKNGEKHYLTDLTIDCAILGYHNQELKILLGKHAHFNGWALPGAYIKKKETLANAAARILKERTSLSNIFLQQFYTFGDNENRLDGSNAEHLPEELKSAFEEDNWLLKRKLSIGYYALIDYSKAEVNPVFPFEDFCWHTVTELPKLLFDHKEIIDKALTTLRNQIHLKPIGYNLLPEKFTLPEIHVLYETILNKKLDRRNFQKKLITLGVLEKLNEKRKIGQHRSPFLYKFDKEKYDEALKEGSAFSF